MKVDNCLSSVLDSLSSRYKGGKALSRLSENGLLKIYSDGKYGFYFGDLHDPLPVSVVGEDNRREIYESILNDPDKLISYEFTITPFSNPNDKRMVNLTITPIYVRYNGSNVVRYMIDVFDMMEDKFNLVNKLYSIEEERRRVIHDMRSALNAIGLYVDALNENLHRGSVDVSVCVEKLGGISGSIQTLYKLIDSYPSLDSIKEDSLGVVMLKDVLEDSLERYRSMYGLDERLVYEELKDNFMVRATNDLVVSAVGNIIDNASHFVDKETGQIRVYVTEHTLSLKNKRLSYAVINIENNGPPIPEELKPFVFVKNVSCRTGGTGCGLSNVKMALENFGGTIELAKSDEESTLFRIYFEKYAL